MPNLVISIVREGWDSGDKWGSAMLALCDIADVMAAADVPVPGELQYRRSVLDSRTVSDIATGDPDMTSYGARVIAEEYLAGRVDVRALTLAALALSRYVDACKRAGLDY